jgi:3-oxoacyl-[acyl-carrier protein] reductase
MNGVALVVGGSGGIGQAICRSLAEAGYDIALTYLRDEAKAYDVEQSVTALEKRAQAYALNVVELSQVQTVVESAER